MKRVVLSIVLALAALVGAAAPSSAQTASPYTPVFIPPDGSLITAKYATSATSASTITISPASSNFIYVTMITIENCAGAAVTGAAPTSVTTTGLGGGTTPVWLVGSTSTAGICNPVSGYWGGPPLKSNTQGSNVTFVLPTFATNQTIRVNVWYFEYNK
jgi:hypothetical protein